MYMCRPILVMIGQKLRSVSRKMWLFLLSMNIEGRIWRHTVTSWVTLTASTILFSVRICDYLFISDVKLRLYWKIRNFQIWGSSFFVRSVTGSWVGFLNRQAYSLYFELLIVALAQISTELWQDNSFNWDIWFDHIIRVSQSQQHSQYNRPVISRL